MPFAREVCPGVFHPIPFAFRLPVRSLSDFDAIMHIDSTVSPAAPPAEPRRSWIAPSVVALGNMRELTLLTNHTIEFECPAEDPFCEM